MDERDHGNELDEEDVSKKFDLGKESCESSDFFEEEENDDKL
jgi:hypothetical protein